MVDFTLTEEQKFLQETARKFALNEIRTVATEVDRMHDPENNFPWDLVKKGMRLGFGNVLIPEAYGGLGGSLIDNALVVEELAYGDSGIADVFLVNIALSRLIMLGANETQKQKWLTEICQDESGTYIIGGAMTEPSGGSEIFCPLPDPKFGVKTIAVKDKDEYIINGAKCFITNGGVSKLYIILARTNKDAPNIQGCSLFLLPEGTPGLSFGKLEEKMGHRLSSVREVVFENARVPFESMLGKEGEGFKLLLECYEGNGVGVGSSAIGVARAAYESALQYAQERIIWGRPIIEYESVGSKLVGMRMKIDAARMLLWKMAWAAEHTDRCGGLNRLGSMAKIFPASIVREVTIEAMEILGGAGYTMEFPVEKYVRDSMLFPIYDGTNDLLKLFLAQQLSDVPA